MLQPTIRDRPSLWKRGPYVLAEVSDSGRYDPIGAVDVTGLDGAIEEMLAHYRDNRLAHVPDIVVTGIDDNSREWLSTWRTDGEERTLIFRDVRRGLWIRVLNARVRTRTETQELTLAIHEANVDTQGPALE